MSLGCWLGWFSNGEGRRRLEVGGVKVGRGRLSMGAIGGVGGEPMAVAGGCGVGKTCAAVGVLVEREPSKAVKNWPF